MRPIFVNRYFYPDESATSQLLSDLAFRLAREGYEVHVVTSRHRYEDPRAGLPRREEVRGVQVHRVATSRWGRRSILGRAIDYLTFYLSAALALTRVVRRDDLVIAETDPPLISSVAAFAAWLKRARLINWMQDIYPEVAERLHMRGVSFVSWLLRWLRNKACASAERNVVIGRCMKEYLVGMGLPAARIQVIPNWVDDRVIVPLGAGENALRREWHLEDCFVAGYSGNMGRVHEFGALLAAAELLRKEPRFRLLFIGEGARRDELLERTLKLGLRNVQFERFQPHERLPQSLTVPDVHVVTLQSQLGGLIVPSKFYAALAAGRPVIFVGPQDSEVARVIKEWNCGICLAGWESNALAESFRRLLADEAMRQEMGRNGRRAMEQLYGREHALAAWQQLIDGVVSDKVPGRRTAETDIR